MNLQQAIHEHWEDSPALASVLSVDRLTTGRTRSGEPPYATVQPRTIRRQLPTNQGPALEETALRFHVWNDDYEQAKAIAEQLREAFDGASLVESGSGQVASLQHAGDSIRQHADGLWQWGVDFTACVRLLP